MIKRHFAAAIATSCAWAASAVWAGDGFTLASVRENIALRYRDVTHISVADLASLDPKMVVLIDTRTKREFAVSHLRGAFYLTPSASAEEILRIFKKKAIGKILVFYCSVGERSSTSVRESQKALLAAGATAVYNLDGGIFGWHNEGRALVRGADVTRDLHPFNRKWGKLVDDASALTKKPR